ncbi:MAG: hypothetical protein U0841_07970 [Chloroflexia bacterium]
MAGEVEVGPVVAGGGSVAVGEFEPAGAGRGWRWRGNWRAGWWAGWAAEANGAILGFDPEDAATHHQRPDWSAGLWLAFPAKVARTALA